MATKKQERTVSNTQYAEQALAQVQMLENLIPQTVTYTTAGHLLILGPEDAIRLAAADLDGMASVTLVATDPITSQDEDHLARVMDAVERTESLPSYYSKQVRLKGFLGQYQAFIKESDKELELAPAAVRRPHYDLVLDLGQSPSLTLELLPPGYFHVGEDANKLAAALSQLPELVGEFSKPRYVKINADICAHHGSGINGCTRCLNFCPADAIASVDNQIVVDHNLCHGAGSCANACPTGAISYDQPAPATLQDYLKRLITRYIELADNRPVVLLHDASAGDEALKQMQALPGEVLPVALEEIAVAATDSWFSALAWGARQVVVLTTDVTPPTLMALMTREQALAAELLEAIGLPGRIELMSVEQLPQLAAKVAESAQWPELAIAAYPASLAKRDAFYNGLDHLNGCAADNQDTLTIPHLPYGKVVVDTDKCTLCQSCSALCPPRALTDGGDMPALNFTEQSCVQCGLCEQACPEKAITLVSQVTLDRELRQQPRVLHEEPPFECIRCGKAFATAAVINKITAQMQNHTAFAGDAIKRIQMCEDCRVKDMFEDILNDPEKQLRV
ncbi:4Fe-4S binding protein [Ferrimonas sp. YFM]|uniref:4Fe-4S binding protein n=1 Tax=Ferrimonas sp. YFM TaxID=3028878 RepID=UPI0025733A6B|nr:4Fe-4S binding protein [Ferrimonas sp. YFM]